MCMAFKPPKFFLQRQRKKIKLCFPSSTRWHAEGLLGRKVIQRPSDLSPFHEICDFKKNPITIKQVFFDAEQKTSFKFSAAEQMNKKYRCLYLQLNSDLPSEQSHASLCTTH